MNNFKLLIIVAIMTVFTGCTPHDDNHEHPHESEQPKQDDHGHAHGGGVVVTDYTDKTELFVEYTPLVKGEESAFAAHLTFTKPDGFEAVSEGKLTVALVGGGLPDEHAEASVSDTAGIFRPVLKPQHVGKRTLILRLSTNDGDITHDLGDVTVYPDRKSAEDAMPHGDETPAIGFTKEQQWKIPFAVQQIAEREVRESVAAVATLRPTSDREAVIAAPGDGLLRAGANGFPQVGNSVAKGQIVAYLAPKLGGETDVASLRLQVDSARIALDQTRVDRERLEGLFKIEAIPEKRLRDALAREKLAQAELAASQQRIATFSGGNGGIALKSPIAGQIVAVGAIAGAAVTAGQSVVHVADLKRLWLDARIAESDVTRVSKPTGAFFSLGKNSETISIEVGKDSRLVAFGGMVDANTRTVPAIFEFDNPDGRLQAGMNVQASIYTGKSTQGVAVPVSAVIDDSGTSVVFVLREGESFERRVITTGSRDGDWVAVLSGLKAGERIVTLGAYQVRLAATAPAAIGHGHAH
ncbi:MAG: efflux transporter periplasmic adaptor subunit [Methylotenera sp.]|nr:MAG: efflux transporter periplasmic adaptor subunit [Methylotenera sp.]